jgi:hypothetical protein
MVSLIACICVLKPVRQRKNIFNRKTRFFSFKCLIFHFSQKFSSYNSVWIRIRIRIRIQTFFGFGSSQNIRIISDSDPQHWCTGLPAIYDYYDYIFVYTQACSCCCISWSLQHSICLQIDLRLRCCCISWSLHHSICLQIDLRLRCCCISWSLHLSICLQIDLHSLLLHQLSIAS